MRPKFRFTTFGVVAFLVLACGTVPSDSRNTQGAVELADRSVEERGTRRALVVGINRYLGPEADPEIVEARGLSNLRGAVRDAEAMAALLEARGYKVKSLIDEQATAKKIRHALDRHLVAPGRPGDDLVFYFAGHGSHVPDLDGDELEGEDETLVAADAARGGPDLVDDELWGILQKINEQKIRLTVILDACYGGSTIRGPAPSGLPSYTRSREVAPKPRSGVRGPKKAGSPLEETSLETPPEASSLLVLGAAQAFQKAHETREESARGVFTDALLRVVTTNDSGEAAGLTFRKTAVLIAADGWFQQPVIAGSRRRHEQPIFADDSRSGLHGDSSSRTSPSVSAVVIDNRADSLVRLEGGWARGLRENDELISGETRVRLMEVKPTQSLGRIESGGSLDPGTVLEREQIGLPNEPDLTLWWSESTLSAEELADFQRRVSRIATAAEIEWVDQPWREAPTHVLGLDQDRGWVLGDRSVYDRIVLGPEPDRKKLDTVLQNLPAGSRLFMQLPLPEGVSRHLGIGDDVESEEGAQSLRNLARAPTPGEAHFRLIGRLVDDRLTYSWARADIDASVLDPSPLPSRSRPVTWEEDPVLLSIDLRESALKLARIRFWLTLRSPSGDNFPYRLALLRQGADTDTEERLIKSRLEKPPRLRFGEQVGLALYSAAQPESIHPRHVYVLLLDSDGRRQLFFPLMGSGNTENRIPVDPRLTAPKVLPIGPQPLLRISEPPGLDTYILLTTGEPLTDLTVLDEDGVRSPRADDHPLARLFLSRHRGEPGPETLPADWSIDRLTVLTSPEDSQDSPR